MTEELDNLFYKYRVAKTNGERRDLECKIIACATKGIDSTHYISKDRVREAIGEDESFAKQKQYLTRSERTIVSRNAFRQELRKELEL